MQKCRELCISNPTHTHKPLTTHMQASQSGATPRGNLERANHVDMSAADHPPEGPSASLMVMQLGPKVGVKKQLLLLHTNLLMLQLLLLHKNKAPAEMASRHMQTMHALKNLSRPIINQL